MFKIKQVTTIGVLSEDNKYDDCLCFNLTSSSFLNSSDIALWYNPKNDEWGGDMICYGKWVDLEKDDIHELKQFLFEQPFFKADKSVISLFNYCHENNYELSSFMFLVTSDNDYVVLDCNCFLCESCGTLQKALLWLLSFHDFDDWFNYQRYLDFPLIEHEEIEEYKELIEEALMIDDSVISAFKFTLKNKWYVLQKYKGLNDYAIVYINDDCSCRGTFLEVLDELKEVM